MYMNFEKNSLILSKMFYQV